MKNQLLLALLAVVPATFSASIQDAPGRAAPAERPLRARWLTTVADDFVVEVWHNGVRVPDDRRTMLVERFGATAERVDVTARAGDWFVFHVVNNRLRWGGAKFFAVAGCAAQGEFSFVSDPASPLWSVCDDPTDARRFVEQRLAGTEVRASPIAVVWPDGFGVLRDHVGPGFHGQPLWGGAPSCWIKVLVD